MELTAKIKRVLGVGVSAALIVGLVFSLDRCGSEVLPSAASLIPDGNPDADLTKHDLGASLLNPLVDAAIPAIPSSIFNVVVYGAAGSGLVDDRPAIAAALAAACLVGGGNVFLPAGTYLVSRNGGNSYAISIPCSNITIVGVPGATTIKLQNGQPANTVVDTIQSVGMSNVTVRDVIIDGGWGNAVTEVTDDNVTLPRSTIDVASTANFPTSNANVTFIDSLGVAYALTCAGPKTATQLTNCTGGSGATMHVHNIIGYVSTNTGINQGTQSDPSSMGFRSQGGSNIQVINVQATNIYGDCFWFGNSSVPFVGSIGEDITIRDSSCVLAARHGSTIGGVNRAHYERFTTKYIFGRSIDSEPFGGYTRKVTVDHCNFGTWWTGAAAWAVNAGGGNVPNQTAYNDATTWRITNSHMKGGVSLVSSQDILVEGNTIVQDTALSDTDVIHLDGGGTDIRVLHNEIWLRQSGQFGINFTADVPAQTANAKMVQISENTVHARNGAGGIQVNQSGGSTTFLAGTATSVTALTVVDTTQTWSANQWQGFIVTIGTAQAMVNSNSACPGTCMLTLTPLNEIGGFPSTYAWMTWTGQPTATPTSTSYTISDLQGYVDIAGNTIDGGGYDLQGDGWGAGGDGIYVQEAAGANGRNGSRVAVRNNILDHVGTNAIHVFTSSTAWTLLEISGNRVIETRSTPITTVGIFFDRTPTINTLIMRDNLIPSSVASYTSGLSSGYWLTNAGIPQYWAGFGTPAGNVTASPGSHYTNVNGTPPVEYVKDNNATDSNGWDSVNAAPQAPELVSQLALVGEDYDANFAGTNSSALTSGQLYLVKVRVYASAFSKVMLMVRGSNESGCSNAYVGIYKSDGTQSASMSTAGIDALSSFSSGSSPRSIVVTLSNSVTGLSVGQDIYVALLPVSCGTGPVVGVPATTFPNGNLSPSNGLRSCVFGSSQSSLPGSFTLSSCAAAGAMMWAAVL